MHSVSGYYNTIWNYRFRFIFDLNSLDTQTLRGIVIQSFCQLKKLKFLRLQSVFRIKLWYFVKGIDSPRGKSLPRYFAISPVCWIKITESKILTSASSGQMLKHLNAAALVRGKPISIQKSTFFNISKLFEFKNFALKEFANPTKKLFCRHSIMS